jgi:EAL domain-containing protein (putative c-di-GMP-specific phosphodiesterase class I)
MRSEFDIRADGATAGHPSPRASCLDEALRSDRIEFWYQPKIDLRLKRLVGAEAFARLRTQENKILPASALMVGAADESVVALTERALVSALKTSANLSEIGIDVPLAINVSVDALVKLPIVDIVLKYRPDGDKCLSLLFDVTETQVLHQIAEMDKISEKLRACGFSVAVDDFGKSILSTLQDKQLSESMIDQMFDALVRLKGVLFSEMKLDRSLVQGCDNDAHRKAICKHIIDLTHNFGSKAVAVGVEKASEMRTLQELNCDIGQGFLFGAPMQEDDFISLIWERGVRSKQRVA